MRVCSLPHFYTSSSSVLGCSSDLIFCVGTNILKPSKVKSLKFSRQLQNYLANTFLSPSFLSLYPFFFKRNFLTCCLHTSLFSILFVNCHWFFPLLSLAVVSYISHFDYFPLAIHMMGNKNKIMLFLDFFMS